MSAPDVGSLAAALRTSIGLFVRQLRQAPLKGELSLPEISALLRLARKGPSTTSELARSEEISPQAMGATVAALEARGLVRRRPDPDDGRRSVISVTEAGDQALADKASARTELLAKALSEGFTAAELETLAAAVPLIERLGERL